MSVDIALAIALAVILAAVAAWSITYLRLRRRVRELERESSRLQGEIKMRMNGWQKREEMRHQFARHLAQAAWNLRRSVYSYNRAVDSVERCLLRGAHRFTEMDIQPKKTPEDSSTSYRA